MPDDGADRPFWSVMIPSHDADDLLADTLASVLAQDPGPDAMQIEVVDDASTVGDPETVVRDLGGDRVGFFCQPRHMGAPAAFTTCVERARGRWVHILYGDDQVEPGFYDAYRSVIDRHPCVMVGGSSVWIDGDGRRNAQRGPYAHTDGLLDDPHQIIVVEHGFDFPAVVVARSAYEQVGGFHTGLVHSNDWHMWCRLSALGPVGHVPEPLALYRRHERSDTTRVRTSSVHIQDGLRAMDLIADQLEPDLALELRATTRLSISDQARQISRGHAAGGQLRPAVVNAVWAARLHPTAATIGNVPRVMAVGALRAGRLRRAHPRTDDGGPAGT
jgi:cellulose synthase/poly-beta-1,6-N-acetylglucosamine synthase-like glycosyltransferase